MTAPSTFDELRSKHRPAYRRRIAKRKAFFVRLNKLERVEARRENTGLTLPAPIIVDGRRQP